MPCPVKLWGTTPGEGGTFMHAGSTKIIPTRPVPVWEGPLNGAAIGPKGAVWGVCSAQSIAGGHSVVGPHSGQ